MSTLLLIVILAINTLISWLNAKVCGRYWSEAKALGGFPRVLMWCGAIQSAVGFSMLLLVAAVAGGIAGGWLSQEAADAATSLWYLIVIVPAIGSGLIITVYSWSVALRERDWMSAGSAAWNTFASVHNIYSAIEDVPSAWKEVCDVFGGDDSSDSSLGHIVLLLVGVSLAGGVLLTAWLIRVYDRRARLDSMGCSLQEYLAR